MVAAYRRTHRLSRLAWFDSWQTSGAQSAFIKWTGWTLAMALPWRQHHMNVVIGMNIIINEWRQCYLMFGMSVSTVKCRRLSMQWPRLTSSCFTRLATVAEHDTIYCQSHKPPVSRDSHNVWVTSLTVAKQQTKQTHRRQCWQQHL